MIVIHDHATSWVSTILVWFALAALVVTSYLYLRAWWRGVQARRGPVGTRHLLWFLIGVLLVVVALVGPVHNWAERSLSGHMTQHMLLMTAPLALVLARTTTGLLLGLDPSTRSVVLTRLGGRWAHRISGSIHPEIALVLLVVVVGIWHIPVLFDAVLHSAVLHDLEHFSLVAVSWVFWSSLMPMGKPRSRRQGPALASILATMLLGTAFGALLTLSTMPWYPEHAMLATALGEDWLRDQQAAGLIMWIPSGLVHLAVFLWLGVAWLNAPRPGRLSPALEGQNE